MDEVLLKQLVRQMRILNIWVSVFGTLFLAALLIAVFLLFKLVTFVHSTQQSLESLQQKTSQTLDVQKNICKSSGISSLVDKASNYCQ